MFLYLLVDYFSDGLQSEEVDLYLVMTFFFVYGIIGMFITLGYQDYNYLQTQIDFGIDPFDEEIDADENDADENDTESSRK